MGDHRRPLRGAGQAHGRSRQGAGALSGAVIRRALAGMVLAIGAMCQAVAQQSADRGAQIDTLIDALKITETVEIMREEGLVFGREVGSDMLADSESDGWSAVVSRIYDAGKMRTLVTQGIRKALGEADPGPMVGFFASPRGQEVIALELAARHAFLDPLLEHVDRLIEDSDLIERNVSGALNANLMFYNGLVDGGALEMSQDDILADVWSQEDAVREDARDWLQSFLVMAYDPLSEADLEAYAGFYRSPAGQALNRATFTAFDRMYEEISYLLGRAVAQRMQSERL